jgi:hypothetical protein
VCTRVCAYVVAVIMRASMPSSTYSEPWMYSSQQTKFPSIELRRSVPLQPNNHTVVGVVSWVFDDTYNRKASTGTSVVHYGNIIEVLEPTSELTAPFLVHVETIRNRIANTFEPTPGASFYTYNTTISYTTINSGSTLLYIYCTIIAYAPSTWRTSITWLKRKFGFI